MTVEPQPRHEAPDRWHCPVVDELDPLGDPLCFVVPEVSFKVAPSNCLPRSTGVVGDEFVRPGRA
ncbi:MAG: hypothetical protein IH616_14850 [Gemmatimonadales bacterium]|nr:hypothetical protein [Gemmatimonadales bacterium]